MRAALVFGVLALSFLTPAFGESIVIADQMAPPEGYPWKLGEGVVTLDGKARAYTTFDFSIGAFDASVQFRKNYDCSGKGACKDTGKVELSIGAYPDGNPDAKADKLYMKAIFHHLPKGKKKSKEVVVELSDIGGEKGKLLRSKGPAKLLLTEVKRGKDGSDSYGRLTVIVTATVCEATEETLIEGGVCVPFKAEFATEVQYDSI